MAEVIGIVASAITIGASAAQLSLALFDVAHTIKNAPKQIAEIAEEFSLLSESLQTLADIIRTNQNVCKPALYQNTHTIISRYKQVDAEIKKLIDTPRKLAGLQWYINKPKAKGLLKKVEGIKTALILQLNIIRLAREEFTRPQTETGPSISVGLPPNFNRFRKVVESAVQANRKVVENAQQDDKDSGTGRRKYTNAELDIWKEGSFDTATWLYHLVFSPDMPDASEANAKRHRLHQASVADESHSSEEDSTSHKQEEDSEKKSMIVWNKQTEPSLVVDRLLSSWTTLSSDQITRSAANQDGNEWREDLLKNIEQAKKEHDLSFDQWELQNEPVRSDDEDFKSIDDDSLSGVTMPTYNFHSNTKNHRSRSVSRPGDDDGPWSFKSGESPLRRNVQPDRPNIRIVDTSTEQRPKRLSREHRVRWEEDMSPLERAREREREPLRRERYSGYTRPLYADNESITSRVHTIGSDRTTSTKGRPTSSFSSATASRHNPFDPKPNPWHHHFERVPSWQEPVPAFQQGPSNPFSHPIDPWAHWSSAAPPYYAPPPPPPAPVPPPAPTEFHMDPSFQDTYTSPPPSPHVTSPRRPHFSREEQSNEAETAAKENAIVTAIEKLLEKRGQDNQLDPNEPRFLKLMELLTAQQEREAHNERERANAAIETQMKLMQAMHDKDNERLKQLENLVEEKRGVEVALQTMWKEEAEKKAQEARNSVMEEMAERQALAAKARDAERRTQQEAEARAAKEIKRLERNHQKEIKRYEDLLRGFQDQQLKAEQDAQLPIRRTRIAEGNRSVDVTEYSTDRRNPFFSSSSNLRNLQYGFSQFGSSLKPPNAQAQHPRNSRRNSSRSSTPSLQSSHASIGTGNTSNATESSQQLIVFPAKADRASRQITKLQTSLAAHGIDSTFEDPEEDPGNQIIPYNHDESGDQLVRSTIFWEAAMLSLGSELLLTMRQAGWRPAYTRTSEKGQTHFLGNQPVHAYFFSPDYKPQFSSSTRSSSREAIVIQKSLVEEYALIELGFEFEAKDSGVYVLDGRLTYNDIESLIERSFLMRENDYRRKHRQLQWHYDKGTNKTSSTRHNRSYTPSISSTASIYSGDGDRTSCAGSDTDTEGKQSSRATTVARYDHSDDDGDHVSMRSRSSRGGSPVKSASVVSWESKSTNPFRKHMIQVKEVNDTSKPQSPSMSIWDGPASESLV
ncbi:hypothetical protein COCMIDRAFT_36207 [Bipolaris oryzae ATCC 44560]|uniref:DUF8035 domain-containing protein n=1 Tax=Bipolaris oryzae ATCC 44560 TaxID=930090 RepID=W6ZF31_COCMI|nr:uncharacterized protein COCMIDRAFT_36207 [Bipolaris oryzae ATCC 44560]EUC46119.1 hypothetical protein COCMIDRAFT_36207 [Bipolaris oryzae ATCC 44560]